MKGCIGTKNLCLHLTIPSPIIQVSRIKPNQWRHIAFQSNGQQTTTIVNDRAYISRRNTPLAHDLSSIERPKDFTLGGFGEKIGSKYHDHFRMHQVTRTIWWVKMGQRPASRLQSKPKPNEISKKTFISSCTRVSFVGGISESR